MEGIERTLREAGRQRGSLTERKVLSVFQERIIQKRCPPWLTGCEKADWEDDRKGCDFLFVTVDVGKLKLQVKSSQRGLEEARRKHPKIPAVCLAPEASADVIFQECINAVSRQRDIYLQERKRR